LLGFIKTILGPTQVFYLPGTIIVLIVFSYLFLIKKDKAAGVILLLGLIIIVDSWMNTGIFIPGFKFGSIRYSEFVLILLFFREINFSKSDLQENTLRTQLLRLFMLYLFFFILSVIRSDNFIVYFFRSFRDIGLTSFLVFYICSSGFESEKDYYKFFIYLVVLGIIITLGSFQEFLFDKIFIHSIFYEISYHQQKNGRFGSFFNNVNLLAFFYILLIPSVIILILSTKRLAIKIYLFSTLFFFLFGLYKTFTRAAFLSFPISLLPIFLKTTKGCSLWKKIIFLLSTLAIILLCSPKFFSGVSTRLSTINDKETVEESRVNIWKGTLKLVSNNMFFGAGFGENRFINSASNALMRGELEEHIAIALIAAQMPHNSYLYILFFMGILPLIVFLVIIFLSLKGIFPILSLFKNSHQYNFTLSIVSSMIGSCIMIFFDYQIFVKSTAAVFWCLIGIGVSFYKSKIGVSSFDVDME